MNYKLYSNDGYMMCEVKSKAKLIVGSYFVNGSYIYKVTEVDEEKICVKVIADNLISVVVL